MLYIQHIQNSSTGGSIRVLTASNNRSSIVFTTSISISRGSAWVLSTSNNRSSIVFITSVKKVAIKKTRNRFI